MAYAFEGVDIAKPEGYSLLHFKEVFSKWDSIFAKKGWLAIFLANHDQARLVSRFGNDKPQFREVSSKMLTTFIMTMRGTPYYYNGDELGMTNAGFTDIKDYRDKATLNEYQYQKNIGGNMAEFMKQTAFSCRDNGRTPFQWNSSANAGFTIGTPWIKVNSNYKTINEAAQDKDPNSPLNYFRRIVKLRKNNLVLVYGKYTLLDKSNPDVYAYARELDGRKLLILLNFRNEPKVASTGLDLSKGKVLIDNYTEPSTDGKLKPYEAVVYQLE